MAEESKDQDGQIGAAAEETTMDSQTGRSGSNAGPDEKRAEVPKKKPSMLKTIWQKAGLDAPTLMMMFKGSLPPTIAIAMYQSDAVATFYGNLGYLIAITSVIGMCIFPRGMFIQNMFLLLLSLCIAAALCLLALFCAVKARENTTPAGASPLGYNSSASAVLALWLFFLTYLANALRAALPQFQFPVIIFSIFSIVSFTNGTQLPNMTAANSFMRTLLVTFLTGFGLATGVHFVILPLSSRKVAFKKMGGYLMTMGGVLKTQAAYLESMERFSPEAARKKQDYDAEKAQHKHKHHHDDPTEPRPLTETPESIKVKELLGKLFELHTKLPGDINFAKRELAIGKIGSKDISEIWKRMKQIMLPISGLTTVLDVLERRATISDWHNKTPSEQEVKTRARQIESLHELMAILHQPFAEMSASINGAFKHVMLILEIEKPPKELKDEENHDETGAPGSIGFVENYKKQLDDFYDSKKRSLREWCEHHNVELPADFFEHSFMNVNVHEMHAERLHEAGQRQLFFALYVEYLLWRAGQTALELVLFVDKRKAEGAFKKTRLIVPGIKTLRKWARAIFGREDLNDEDHFIGELDAGASNSLLLGESYTRRRDPEHLPANTALEKIGEVIRYIPRAFRSDASAFGFRVSVALMSLAIIGFLQATQAWFLRVRALWAVIMVPLSMTRTAGQSIFSFSLRILGTIVAMIGAYIVYYIVDGHTAGVIVFLWLWIFLAFWIVAKQPKMIIVGILAIVTTILIIGYELQVDKIGVQAATTQQPYYPTYTLAPYRLGAVCAGIAVAFFWTIFPYPVTESTELRKDIGAALYLLANLYSVVHETIRSRLRASEHGDEETKGTRAYHLKKASQQVLTKLIALLTTLKQNSAFSRMQIQMGGRFPREEYESLIALVQRVLQYTALIDYASSTFSAAPHDPDSAQWSRDFRRMLASVDATSHRLTSLLALLSSAVGSARPLPPYLEVPRHGKYWKNLRQIDTDILGIRHIAEPEYSAFAVMTICAQCINDDMFKLTRHVKTLVGEIDFSFHAVSTQAEDSDSGFSLAGGDEKKREGSESS